MTIGILETGHINESLRTQVSGLYRQLSPGKNEIPLEEILNGPMPATIVYCDVDGKIKGIALMCTYKVISGYKGWIEDVVVDEDSRGKGIGRKLIERLLELARDRKLTEVLLFTEDDKAAAIHLYKSLGFRVMDSRIYRLQIPSS